MNRTAAFRATALAFAIVLSSAASHADTFVVDAKANSVSGGTGLATITLTAGEVYEVNVGLDDLWSAGALPRYSNADGLTHDLDATGSDESGQPAGTLIGQNFGLLDLDGLVAPYGSLVGRIDDGAYFIVGVSFSSVATQAGVLTLFDWDSNAADNFGTLTVDAGPPAVPEPQTWALLLAGLAAVGIAARRRRA